MSTPSTQRRPPQIQFTYLRRFDLGSAAKSVLYQLVPCHGVIR